MGLGGISLTQLMIVLAIVLVIFGTKRVKTLGSDLGGAISGFRKAMHEDDGSKDRPDEAAQAPLLQSEKYAEPENAHSERADRPSRG